jgi:hypothetical protein
MEDFIFDTWHRPHSGSRYKRRYVKLRVGRGPVFFYYGDLRIYGFDLLMRATPDRAYGCIGCASSFSQDIVCRIWDAARDVLTESELEAGLRAFILSNSFCLRQMAEDIVLSDGGEGIANDCPEPGHPAMVVVSRLIRELVKEKLSTPSYSWRYEPGLGWADLTEAVRQLAFDKGSEVIQEMSLLRDLGL